MNEAGSASHDAQRDGERGMDDASIKGIPGGVRPDVLATRRRLLRGGLAAAPVMMTLVSRPVSAGTGGAACTAASAVASINASRSDRIASCAGRSPTSWKDGHGWPSSCTPSGSKATMFNSVFSGNVYPGVSMMDVLKFSNTTGQAGLARYLAAAYLNASSKLVPDSVLSQRTVQNIWNIVVAQRNGWYEPTAGIRWYPDYSQPSANQPAGIIAWVKTTMA